MIKTIRIIAEQARDYALSIIATGKSQVISLVSKKEEFFSGEISREIARLGDRIEQLREDSKSINCTSDQLFMSSDKAKQLRELDIYINSIKLVREQQLGNCNEHAFVVLSYLIENYPDIRAEIFCLPDHAFVVLNRQPDSDESNPLTWGEDAYICDSWGLAAGYPHSVFPTRCFQTHLARYSPRAPMTTLNIFHHLNYSSSEIQSLMQEYRQLVRPFLQKNIRILELQLQNITSETDVEHCKTPDLLPKIQAVHAIDKTVQAMQFALQRLNEEPCTGLEDYLELKLEIDRVLKKAQHLLPVKAQQNLRLMDPKHVESFSYWRRTLNSKVKGVASTLCNRMTRPVSQPRFS